MAASTVWFNAFCAPSKNPNPGSLTADGSTAANPGKEGFRSTDEYAIRRGELEPNQLTGDEK